MAWAGGGAPDPAGLATTRRTRPPGYVDAQAELPGANPVGSVLPTPPGCSRTFRGLGLKPGGGVRVRVMRAQQAQAGSCRDNADWALADEEERSRRAWVLRRHSVASAEEELGEMTQEGRASQQLSGPSTYPHR